MNLLASIAGLFLALLIIYLLRKNLRTRELRYYAYLLTSFPVFYISFSVIELNYAGLIKELLASSVFFFIVYSTRYCRQPNTIKLLATGMFLHGLYDIFHSTIFINPGIPVWWPAFCGAVDIVLAAYLISLIRFKASEYA